MYSIATKGKSLTTTAILLIIYCVSAVVFLVIVKTGHQMESAENTVSYLQDADVAARNAAREKEGSASYKCFFDAKQDFDSQKFVYYIMSKAFADAKYIKVFSICEVGADFWALGIIDGEAKIVMLGQEGVQYVTNLTIANSSSNQYCGFVVASSYDAVIRCSEYSQEGAEILMSFVERISKNQTLFLIQRMEIYDADICMYGSNCDFAKIQRNKLDDATCRQDNAMNEVVMELLSEAMKADLAEPIRIGSICTIKEGGTIASFFYKKEGRLKQPLSAGISLVRNGTIKYSIAPTPDESRIVGLPEMSNIENGKYFFISRTVNEIGTLEHLFLVDAKDGQVSLIASKETALDAKVCQFTGMCADYLPPPSTSPHPSQK